jgi:hypothetical protein
MVAVPYDQWLTTHLDTSWTIKQVKHWILSKCNLVHSPDLPRYRTVSPITFASLTRSSFDSSNDGDSADNNDDDIDDDYYGESDVSENRNRNLAHAWHSKPPRRSESSADDPPSPSAHDNNNSISQYIILTFSNGLILDDDFLLSWYDIRPYELFEIHLAGSIIRLPREIVVHYARPYFEARVKSPSLVGKVGSRSGKILKGGRDKLTSSEALINKSKRRTKLDWRDRWVVIHQGVLSLRKDRMVSSFPLFLSFLFVPLNK